MRRGFARARKRLLPHESGLMGSEAGRAGSAAVLSGLVAVLKTVRAGGGLALAVPADAAQAVGGELASLHCRATRAVRRTSAIRTGLVVVSNAVGARRSLAGSLRTHAGETVGAHLAGVTHETWTAWATAVKPCLANRRIKLVVGARQSDAPGIVTQRCTAAIGKPLNAFNTLAAVAYAFTYHGAGFSIWDERGYWITRFAEIAGARQPILIKVAGLYVFDQIPLTVAPFLLAVPRTLRRDFSRWLELKAADPARARRRPAPRIARLLAIGLRDALAQLTAGPARTATASGAAPRARPALGFGSAHSLAEPMVGFRANTHLVRADRPRVIITIIVVITGNEHPVGVAACAGAKPDKRKRDKTKPSHPRPNSLSTKCNRPLSHLHCILQRIAWMPRSRRGESYLKNVPSNSPRRREIQRT